MTQLDFSDCALSSANEACCQTPNEGAFVKSAAMDGRVGVSISAVANITHSCNRDAIMEDRKNKAVASAVPVRIERP